MVQDTPEEEAFHGWLHDRMKEADVTPLEKAEFMQWLMARSCDGEDGHGNRKVSFNDVLQLVGWLKIKMNESCASHQERHDLCAWLAEKLTVHSCLTDDELQRAREEMSSTHLV
jgi:hypothetical protein